ncbi:MAG: hypothetical protein RPU15_17315 [Candidatus Sedimenticola sp. (ex Thyasira tokunagai)]
MRPSRIFINTTQEAVNAIETSSEIPVDAKAAIKDFIRENFEALQKQASDLVNFPIPDSIADHWQIVVEILQRIFGLS